MNYVRTITYTAIILLLCTYVSFAEETKPSFKVGLSITCPDKGTEQAIESYLSRELRSLGDVDIVDPGEDIILEIIALKDLTVSGKVLGYSFSVVYIEPIECDDLPFMHRNAHRIYGAGPNGLRNRCEDIIVDFDSTYLKSGRKFRKGFDAMIKARKAREADKK